MQIDQTYEVVRIDDAHDPLKEHPANPNKSDDETIGESIDVNGWYGAVIAQKSTGYILAGHGRYRSAKAREAKELPVIWKDVDDEQALKILLVDNESARKAKMDQEQLYLILSNLESLEGTGYDKILHPLEDELNGDHDDEPTPEDHADAEEEAQANAGGERDDEEVPDDNYRSEYGVIIVCSSEDDQRTIFEAFRSMVTGESPDVALNGAWDLFVQGDVKVRVVAT